MIKQRLTAQKWVYLFRQQLIFSLNASAPVPVPGVWVFSGPIVLLSPFHPLDEANGPGLQIAGEFLVCCGFPAGLYQSTADRKSVPGLLHIQPGARHRQTFSRRDLVDIESRIFTLTSIGISGISVAYFWSILPHI